MKYSIPQERLDKVLFRYLDISYGDLEKVKGEFFDILFKKPNSDYGIIGYNKKSKKLYIFYKLAEEISGTFSLILDDSYKVIGRWVEARHQIEVIGTLRDYKNHFSVSLR